MKDSFMHVTDQKQQKQLKSSLIIYRREHKIHSMLIQGDKLIKVTTSDNSLVRLGDIQVVRVMQIVKNINAAFVKMDEETKAFLPFKDNSRVFITSKGSFGVPKQGDDILVQTSMLQDKGKEVRVSPKLSLSGKYVIAAYGKGGVSCSSKLSADIKSELIAYVKQSTENLDEKQVSIIIRTNAGALLPQEYPLITEEIEQLSEQMSNIFRQSVHREYGVKVFQAPMPYIDEIRNLHNDLFDTIVTDDAEIYAEVKEYLSKYQKKDLNKLVLYQDNLVSMPVLYGLEHKMDIAFQKKVWLPSGGYLYIEPTEAMTVIDVNSGKFSKKIDKETAAFLINKEAAEEISYQLSLRNISGIIIIDFINMKLSENNDGLLDYFRKCISSDTVKCEIIDITALGLVEITRKKTDKTLNEQIFG